MLNILCRINVPTVQLRSGLPSQLFMEPLRRRVAALLGKQARSMDQTQCCGDVKVYTYSLIEMLNPICTSAQVGGWLYCGIVPSPR